MTAPSIKEAFERLLFTAKVLQQNSVGCATNHYGHDCELNGLPGWLTGTQKDIDDAVATLATFQPSGEGREAIARAIAAYNEVWNGWPELEAKNVDECREEAMKAALLASGLVQNEAGIPDGYVLAPIEPTETMLAACEESKPENAKTERRRILATRLRDEGRSIRRADYRAMISAIRSARDGGES